jgi:hypothetical protein
VVDSLRPSEVSKIAESLTGDKPAAAPGESIAALILGQVAAMQKALKDDEELVVLASAAVETLRVLEIYAPSPRLLVVTGIDSQRTVTRVIAPADSLQLVCKVMKAQEQSRPVRIRLIAPKG